MKTWYAWLFLLLCGLSGLASAKSMFYIQAETGGDLVKGGKGLLKLTVTNNSEKAADVVLQVTQADGQVLQDKLSCPLIQPNETCHAVIGITPAKAGEQQLVIQALSFDSSYVYGETVQLLTVHEVECFKAVYLSDQKSEFAQAWALIHGLGNTENTTIYINRHNDAPWTEQRGGRTITLAQAITDKDDVSQQINAILTHELGGFGGKIHLYIQSSLIADTHQTTIDASLAPRIASVTVFPVGTSMLDYNAARFQKLSAFASDLHKNGVETVKVTLWDTLDPAELASGSLSQFGNLRKHGVILDTFNLFDQGRQIASLGVKDLVLTGGLYAQLIPESAVAAGSIFVPTDYFSDKKHNTLLLNRHDGVLGRHYSDSNHNEAWPETLLTQKTDELLQTPASNLQFGFNIIYQVRDPSENISYFRSSFPLILWIALGHGTVTYQHHHQQRTDHFPQLPNRVLSLLDNELLYSIDMDRMTAIAWYGTVDSPAYKQIMPFYETFLQRVGLTRNQLPFMILPEPDQVAGVTDESSDSIANQTVLETAIEVASRTETKAVTEAVVPETVVSEAVVSETVVPETVVSEAVVPETVVSETVVSETLVSEAVVSETLVSEAVVSETVVPETVVPETVVPEAVVPETVVPETVVSETVVSEAVVPETVVSETVVPETLVSEAVVPETVVSEAVVSETLVSETVVPETVVSETVVPETVVPETVVPETVVPEAVVPETVVSETVVPETVVSETVVPETACF